MMRIFKHQRNENAMKSRKFLISLGVLILIAAAFYAATRPPSLEYLKEHPEAFRFEDYSTEKELQKTLTILFPIGTKRSQVEEILIDHLGLQAGYSKEKNGNYFISYIRSGEQLPSYVASRFFGAGLRQAQFEYDSNDRVTSIKSHIIDGKTPPKFFTGDLIKKGEKL